MALVIPCGIADNTTRFYTVPRWVRRKIRHSQYQAIARFVERNGLRALRETWGSM